jgi:hypothetical protein
MPPTGFGQVVTGVVAAIRREFARCEGKHCVERQSVPIETDRPRERNSARVGLVDV